MRSSEWNGCAILLFCHNIHFPSTTRIRYVHLHVPACYDTYNNVPCFKLVTSRVVPSLVATKIFTGNIIIIITFFSTKLPLPKNQPPNNWNTWPRIYTEIFILSQQFLHEHWGFTAGIHINSMWLWHGTLRDWRSTLHHAVTFLFIPCIALESLNGFYPLSRRQLQQQTKKCSSSEMTQSKLGLFFAVK